MAKSALDFAKNNKETVKKSGKVVGKVAYDNKEAIGKFAMDNKEVIADAAIKNKDAIASAAADSDNQDFLADLGKGYAE